ncbi:hypothetical protein [Senegalia sp. (in: firmicutes)]|uniref:hypothetical protein n=1 Tax=Senegalia sp. (in: firmicutes) TaxID=1924098 RepID=UPI003F9C169C
MSKISISLITIGVILILFIIVSYVAKIIFDQNAEKEIKDFFTEVENTDEIVSQKDLENLPKMYKNGLNIQE